MKHASDFTLIVPVWNRFRFIGAAQDFYADMPFRVIVADSSMEANQFEVRGSNIEYHYHGSVQYFENIAMALRKVSTSFCAIVNDDDFILPRAADRYIERMKLYGYKVGYGKNLFFDGEFVQRVSYTKQPEALKQFFSHEYFLPLNHGVVDAGEALELFEVLLSDDLMMTIRSHDATFSFSLCLGGVPYIDKELYFLNRLASMTYLKNQKPDQRVQSLYPAVLRRHVNLETWLREYQDRALFSFDDYVARKLGVSAKEARDYAVEVMSGIDSARKDRRPSFARQTRRWRESAGGLASREWNALIAGRGAEPRPGGKGSVSKILTQERSALLSDAK